MMADTGWFEVGHEMNRVNEMGKGAAGCADDITDAGGD